MTIAAVARRARWVVPSLAIVVAATVVACAKSSSTPSTAPMPSGGGMLIKAPSPDPRVGLRPGTMDDSARIATPAAEAIWNMKMVSHTPLPRAFERATTSDLAFTGNNVIQGNYNGFLVWDVSNPARPTLKVGKECPASQDDVSVIGNLLVTSSEAGNSRLDCGKQGITTPANEPSKDRIRGVRIFDISDITNPRQITAVQTCRGSHTHSLLVDPNDKENFYIYISGTSGIRSPEEVPGCVADPNDPNTTQFRIEVIKVPYAHPELAAKVSAPAIFANGSNAAGLVNTANHGQAPVDTTAAMRAFIAASARQDTMRMQRIVDSLKRSGILASRVTVASLAYVDPNANAAGRGGRGGGGGRGGRGGGGVGILATLSLANAQTAADTARVQHTLDSLKTAGVLQPSVTVVTFNPAGRGGRGGRGAGGFGAAGGTPIPRGTLTQCHDITTYPGVGLAGGACAGMGLLLDIKDPANPRRIDAVADSNFSFWHSATFSNDGSMVLFSDEWGGGGAAYCRATDPKTWGADALFKIVNGKMVFQSYYKLPAAQTPAENCVAHNGSLIPIPGRTVMVQAFYQGGLTMFDWSDPAHPQEIGFFDRGPYAPYFVDGGFWSVYWYNGYIYGSEIKRGLDVFELTPSAAISQNEIDAAKTVHLTQLNVQDQPKFVWPASFALSRAYLDQLERNRGMSKDEIASARSALRAAEGMSGDARKSSLQKLATDLHAEAAKASDASKAHMLATSVGDLAGK